MALTPTPAYDMLPMIFAPAGANMVDREFRPRLPTVLNRRTWHGAATRAMQYRARLGDEDALSDGFRRIAADCRVTLARLVDARS